MKFKNFLVLVTCFTLISSNIAFAARFGNGGKYGMQRSTTNYNYRPSGQNTTSQTSIPQQNSYSGQQNRSGMGAGTAAALGAAAGAAGGYMLGRSMSGGEERPQNASGTQSIEPQGSNIPWGTIGILAILLFLGLLFFRRSKTDPKFSGNMNNPINSAPPQFNIPNIKQRTAREPNKQTKSVYKIFAKPEEPEDNLNKMPDGVETIYFLRQVKGIFLHIQSMNNLDNITEIKKYMTEALYQEMQDTISDNKFVADFTQLDCHLLNCEMSESRQLLASVRFFGLVSEEPDADSKPFSEIWNFIKMDLENGKWLVAGIEQEKLSK
ncbi:MAG: Tim44 domain-containing protein [Burkholderiales bacterium]|nr:Tim44 domain-containing protein [Burkholderiales bacterium]